MEEWFSRLSLPVDNGGMMLLVAGALAMLGGVLWGMRRPIGSALRGRRLRRAVSSLGPELLSDTSFPDGIGGSVKVDFLVLTAGGLLAILVKRYPGVLFAGDTLEQWVQRVDGRSYRFDNPLIQLDHLLASLRGLLPGVPIRGVLVFDEAVEFPKGRPDRVLLPAELSALAAPDEAQVDERLYSAWERLCRGGGRVLD